MKNYWQKQNYNRSGNEYLPSQRPQIQELRDLFRNLDLSKNGKISKGEFRAFFSGSDLQILSDSDFLAIFEQFDVKVTGALDMEELEFGFATTFLQERQSKYTLIIT